MNERKSQLDAVAVASLLFCCALWGFNHVATKVALTEIPPLAQASARSLGASVLVGLWARGRGIPLLERDGTLVGGLLAGSFFAVEFACIFVGLQYTAASRMVVFIYFAPFVLAFAMPYVARAERLSPIQMVGLVAAFAGVASAFAESFTAPAVGEHQWLGDALGVVAALLWAATTLVIRATPLSYAKAEKTLLYQLLISGVTLGVASLVVGEPLPLAPSHLAILALAFQTVIVTFASYLLWFWLVRHYPATLLASFTLLTPITGLLSGVILLDEPITLRLAIALVAVAAGIAVVNRPRSRSVVPP